MEKQSVESTINDEHKSILIVEDDEVLRQTLAYNLKKEGYTVFDAADGINGLKLAREHEPDLIILDIMLPELDGLSVCRLVRREMDVLVIMLSARAGDLVLDAIARKVYKGNDELNLTYKEFDLLAELMRNQGVVLSRDLLVSKVWGYDSNDGSRTVDVHIRWLRSKIEENPSKPQRITTIQRVGYRFGG